jgi:hypothetical protein
MLMSVVQSDHAAMTAPTALTLNELFQQQGYQSHAVLATRES